MTREDYKRIASALSRVRPDEADEKAFEQWCGVVDSIGQELACDNHRFNMHRFIAACTMS